MRHGYIKVAAGASPVRVGDCVYNRTQIADAISHYARNGVEVIFFPQLSITGSTCGDLFFQQSLIDSARNSLLYIAHICTKTEILVFVGLPYNHEGRLYNCMAAVHNGAVLGIMPCACACAPVEQNARYFTEWHGENVTTEIFDSVVPFGTKQFFCIENHSAKIACVAAQNAGAGMQYTEHAIAGANIIGLCASQAETASLYHRRRDLLRCESSRLICGIASAYAGEGESTTDAAYSGYCQISSCGDVLSESGLFSRSFAVGDIDTDYICAQRSKNGFPLIYNNYLQTKLPLSCDNFQLTSRLPQNPYLPKAGESFNDFYSHISTICAHALAKRMAHANAACAVIGISGGLDSCLALLTTVKAFNLLKMPLDRISAISMPCFGTSEQTQKNAQELCNALGVTLKEINIKSSVQSHFNDIEHSFDTHDITFENAQARMRTLVLMDIANKNSGIVIGTGDLSELALGWATYGGDHMSMYGVNAGIPKTIIKLMVSHIALNTSSDLSRALLNILDTPVSPELLPLSSGNITQKTEDIVGPYALHDFFIYYAIKCQFPPKKVIALAANAFESHYDFPTICKWLRNFYGRFFAQQFKRSCMPDGPMALDISLSPRGGLVMPSDAVANLWKDELTSFEIETFI